MVMINQMVVVVYRLIDQICSRYYSDWIKETNWFIWLYGRKFQINARIRKIYYFKYTIVMV